MSEELTTKPACCDNADSNTSETALVAPSCLPQQAICQDYSGACSKSNILSASDGENEEDMNVKSTAVVKYSGIPTASYQRLQVNTDLNAPPANWLQGTSKWHSYMRNMALGRPANSRRNRVVWSSRMQNNGEPEEAESITAPASATTAQGEESTCSTQPFISNSFQMAYCFPDLVGEVDVISDAENMKRLLKLPYSSGQISMMAHRVDNSILLDDFDVHRRLLRKQASDWQWLRKFYDETVIHNMRQKVGDKCVLKKNKSRDHLRNRNMFSKFLYYSLADEASEELAECCRTAEQGLNTSSYQCMPDPLPECEPDTTEHQRTVLWQFEDIHMLIGSDLPIFGGGTHPCVSLRLRDMDKPIKVLTGLDYWLDNLMCNVPELAMCYHLNGIVQNYEIVKTEDLPNWEDSKFSPQVIKDTARNILSFLKTNATKEGHTYWLFKAQGDDIVKLYDLTTLCADSLPEPSNNPYTMPVGLLLYRVARNMRQTMGRKKSGTIRALLDNCLMLLDPNIHSQVFTSAHYLLSDLYVSDNIYEKDPEKESTDSSSDEETDRDGQEEQQQETTGPVASHTESKPTSDSNSTAVSSNTPSFLSNYAGGCDSEQSSPEDTPNSQGTTESASCVEVAELSNQINVKLCPEEKTSRHPPISGTAEERCQQALKHIAEGLACLEGNMECPSQATGVSPPREPTTCNPSEAIPMHYQPLKKTASESTATSSANENAAAGSSLASQSQEAESTPANQKASSEVTVYSKSMPVGSWHTLSKALLFRKAVICYYKLATRCLSNNSFRKTLHYLALALQCFGSLENLNSTKAQENSHLLIAVLALAADAHFLMRAAGEEEEPEVELGEHDAVIKNSTTGHGNDSEYSILVTPCLEPEAHLERSVECLQQAVDLTASSHLAQEQVYVLMKRYGNVYNELGVLKMNKAAGLLARMEDKCEGSDKGHEQAMLLAMQSWKCLEHSQEAFSGIGDAINQALVYCNMGRVMRVCVQAQAAGDIDRHRHYYQRAQENYQHALRLLPQSANVSAMRESITWELCSTYFFLGCLLQDGGVTDPSSQQEVEKMVIDVLTKSLKYCSLDSVGQRRAEYQDRGAAIHHRLASLYHNAYRKQQGPESRLKQLRCLAELHYGKASALLQPLQQPCQLLRVQLEQIALSEHHLAGLTNVSSRLRLLQTTLHSQLLACRPVLAQLHLKLCESDPVHDGASQTAQEAAVLMDIWQSRLNATLLHLVKSTTPNAGKRKAQAGSNNSAPAAKYKSMYSAALRAGTEYALDLGTRCQHLLDLIDVIEKNDQSEESKASSSVT